MQPGAASYLALKERRPPIVPNDQPSNIAQPARTALEKDHATDIAIPRHYAGG